ncbi:MAG: hypothetical protein HYY18_19665 [Planctomycetes bacterium]|nr:hypothetical protein [Planctomycetota bacterium]
MARPLIESESLSRFLIHSNAFNFTGGFVKSRAFMPPTNLRLSVFRTQDWPEVRIWEAGQREVAAPLHLTLYGRAELSVAQVQGTGLSVDPDEIPQDHANIIGWPSEKDAQKSIAQDLAAAARLILKP